MKEQINSIVKKRNPFTQISNEILNCRDLSLKSKGLYCFMFSKPDNWNFTASSMATQLIESRKTILKMLQELKARGIVEYIKNSNGTGKYILNDELPKSQNDTMAQNSQSPKMTSCKNYTVQKTDCISNKDISSKTYLYSNPDKEHGSEKKPKVKLKLSNGAAEFRQKLINSKYVGKCASVLIEGEKEDVYINEDGRLYSSKRSPREILSSTLNEIWEQLHEAHQTKYGGSDNQNPIQNLQIKKFGA